MSEGRTEQILAGLKQLDPGNDDHWTGKGLPAISAVRSLSGLADVTRAEIKEAGGDWSRETAGATDEPEATASVQIEVGNETEAPVEELTEKSADAALAEVEQCEADLQLAHDAQAAIAEQVRERQIALDNAKAKCRALGYTDEPRHIRNTRAIQAMLRQSQKDRENRAALREALIGKGVPASRLPVGSPIDQAMRAKRGRPRPRSLGGRIAELVTGDK